MMNKQKMLIPNEFQTEALIELEKAELTKNSGIIVMPTGTGKTYLAVLWFKKQLDINPNSKLLFICHNKDIISQANEKEFQEGLTNLDISYGYYTAKEKNIQQATFATVQTLTRNLDVFDKTQFDYIIVDEAHHYQAKTFKKAVQYFTPKFLLGLTATPNRLDGKKITDICGDIVFDSKISDAISKQLLVPIKYYCVDHNIDFSNIKWNGTNYDAKDLNKKLCIKEYDDAILKEYNETVIKQHNRHKTICFCATIEHCRRMEQLFISRGILSIALTGSDNSVKRKNTVYEFRNGKYDIIFVRDLFNEGVDIPDADCVMFLRPTQSHTIFTQQIGRGLRTAVNKKYLLALDFTGNSKKCDINFEVLDEIVDFNILNRVRDKNNSGTSVYYANNGCEINLTREKIDILNDIKHTITKQELIDAYFKLKKQLGKQPTRTYFDKNSKYNPYNINKLFGSWNKFLESIDEPLLVNYDVTKQQLIDAYFEVKKQLGKLPTRTEFDKNSKYNQYNIDKLFGSWNKFLESIDEPSLVNYDVTKQQLIDAYFEVKKQLGKLPTRTYFVKNSKYNQRNIRKLFGSWNNLLESIDEPINKYETKQQLIDDYFELKKQLGKQPTCREFVKYSKYTQYNVVKLFDSWNKFLKSIDEPIKKYGTNKKNVNIISNYTPVTSIKTVSTVTKKESKKIYNIKQTKYKTTNKKVSIRSKIIKYIKNNDTILLLESPELSAIKEIELQGKTPKKIIIPNNKEFNDLADALSKYDTKLNIEIVNTSALQYIADTKELFDFVWLDYCGAFSSYQQDLDILLKKNNVNFKLILTYTTFDPRKDNDNNYMINVVDYVLANTGNHKIIRLLKDISYRYKQNMYNIGVKLIK